MQCSNLFFFSLQRSIEEFMESEVEPADLLLQRAMPLMERKITAMEANVVNSLNGIRQTVDSLSTALSDLTSGRVYLQFAGAGAIPSDNGEAPTTTNTQEPYSIADTSSQGEPHRTTPPRYRMSRGVKSVTDLWREWYSGLGGGYAVNDLELRYGASWRNNDRQFYNRRKRIIDEIKKYATVHSVTEETAVGIAENRRIERKKTLDYLGKHVDEIFS